MKINKISKEKNNIVSYPNHIAIIMDGNRRWAKKNKKLNFLGHREGVKTVKKIIGLCLKYDIKALTLYAFSSENWKRSIDEVSFLMNLFKEILDLETRNLKKKKIRLKIIGNKKKFNFDLQKAIIKAENLTKNNSKLLLNIAANYGGRWDIVNSIKKIAVNINKGLLDPENINENIVNNYICLNDISPVDLVIRTGGEYRISNFLIWQIAYSELYFTKKLWPDFNKKDFKKALNSFTKRNRRFGGD
ncbi:di-trans,poly-cis-decaprenylcistransferase [Enterobacteriaceae endosymbiont of Donacia bicoloricornis]|uniref:polyprenyl diphosphate synthase n=1 Tax=Enterobacteriaceae endosymbiont of Donacia bicoloricornis TaxID=2675772 RepID=UPI00144A05E3|nr:polyprenyl diphosphate synthase [Enterobacteriaceae endosymbiont of Donacia bicoloricornis]QJC37750.1 di-trans,poly-cis-decaprenylcistransferase [Enterobacteriaceae endosymbiont of Donacia bicoloricornis]